MGTGQAWGGQAWGQVKYQDKHGDRSNIDAREHGADGL